MFSSLAKPPVFTEEGTALLVSLASTAKSVFRKKLTSRRLRFKKFRMSRRYKYRKQLCRPKKKLPARKAFLRRLGPLSLRQLFVFRAFRVRRKKFPVKGPVAVRGCVNIKMALATQAVRKKRRLKKRRSPTKRLQSFRCRSGAYKAVTLLRKRSVFLANKLAYNLAYAGHRSISAFMRARFRTTGRRLRLTKLRTARLARAQSQQTLAWGSPYRYARPKYFVFHAVPGARIALSGPASRLGRALRTRSNRSS